jgi:endo-1,4-beta-xylanase
MHITRRQLTAASVTSLALAACGNNSPLDADSVNTAPDGPTPSLGQALSPHFPFGSAITPSQVSGGDADFLKSQFTVVVAENAMKPAEISTAEGQYNFTAADAMVNFARDNGIKVRGHTLIWHQQTPSWMFSGSPTREILIARIERYITDVVTHFKGRVYAWDVVNEAFVFNEKTVSTDSDGMRMSQYREIIGPDYIEIAFRAAAKADPDALLFYNDYETQNLSKVSAISKMVTELKAKGVKIDGIGHQAHYTVAHPPISTFEAALLDYTKLEVTQHITEMDIALNANIMDSKVSYSSADLLALQAERYADFFKLFIKHKAHVTAVLVWGIDDAHTWLKYWPNKRFEAPLLFDERQRPKPAFWSVHKVATAA